MHSNATLLSPVINMQSISYGSWTGDKIRVETIGSRRFLRYIRNNGHVFNSADVTFWNPAGQWLSVTGKTGGATSTALMTSVRLNYL